MKGTSFHTSFWLLCVAVVSILCLPSLVQQGMFLDGVTYAAISKNLSNGIGSVWQLQYTATFNHEFYGHPPFYFIIQSLFFTVLGDHFMVERIFSFFLLVCTAYGIVLLWRKVTAQFQMQLYAWVPVLMWITIPQVAWTFTNNMLEAMVSPLVLFALYFYYRSTESKSFIYIIIGTFFVWFAYGVKGPVALFPIVLFIVHYIVFREYTLVQAIAKTILILVLFVVFFAILFTLQPQSFETFRAYHYIQVFSALQGGNQDTVSWHGALLLPLVGALAPLIVLCTLVYMWNKRKQIHEPINHMHTKYIIFFLLLGLAGSIPLMVTLKQRLFYAVPSFSLFAMAAAIFFSKFAQNIPQNVVKIIRFAAYIMIIVSGIIVGISYKNYAKDAQLLRDIETLKRHIPPFTIVKCDTNLVHNWKVIAYLQRNANISISEKTKQSKYILVDSQSSFAKPSDSKQITFASFVLFEKNNIFENTKITKHGNN